MTLGERIKKARKALDLTQQKFADQIGTTQNNIASYEIGRREPSATAINNICKTFNINETWLRTGEGEMFNPKSSAAMETLARERGLTHSDFVLIEKFLSMKPESRLAVAEYMLEVAAALNSDSPTVPTIAPAAVDKLTRTEKPVSEWTDADIDAETEEYRRSLLEEKKRAGNGSASSASGGTRLA